MQKSVIVLSLALLWAGLSQAQELALVDNSPKMAAFSWETQHHTFGQIEKAVPVSKVFTFVNTGEAPLIIERAKGSCGCTVTEYTSGLIMPGETGMVRATYNAAKVGAFHKTVTVEANTADGPVVLTISGEVME